MRSSIGFDFTAHITDGKDNTLWKWSLCLFLQVTVNFYGYEKRISNKEVDRNFWNSWEKEVPINS